VDALHREVQHRHGCHRVGRAAWRPVAAARAVSKLRRLGCCAQLRCRLRLAPSVSSCQTGRALLLCLLSAAAAGCCAAMLRGVRLQGWAALPALGGSGSVLVSQRPPLDEALQMHSVSKQLQHQASRAGWHRLHLDALHPERIHSSGARSKLPEYARSVPVVVTIHARCQGLCAQADQNQGVPQPMMGAPMLLRGLAERAPTAAADADPAAAVTWACLTISTLCCVHTRS
jgi:hypothetical protein